LKGDLTLGRAFAPHRKTHTLAQSSVKNDDAQAALK
jgi:hypothetical protein